MTAIRERIHAAIKTALAAMPVDGLQVYRNRHTPITKFPTLVVFDGAHEPIEDETGLTRFRLTPLVVGFVRTDGEDPAPMVSALYVAAVKALFVDLTLGGVAVDIREGAFEPNIEPEGDRERQAQFRMEFLVDFMTEEGAPDTLPSEE